MFSLYKSKHYRQTVRLTDRPQFGGGIGDAGKAACTRVARPSTELLFDVQQPIVFANAIGSAQRTRLDLPAAGTHRQIGDRGVFGLA